METTSRKKESGKKSTSSTKLASSDSLTAAAESIKVEDTPGVATIAQRRTTDDQGSKRSVNTGSRKCIGHDHAGVNPKSLRKASRSEWMKPTVTPLGPAQPVNRRQTCEANGTADQTEVARVANVFVHDFGTRATTPDLSRLRGFFGERDLVWREVQFSSDRRRALAGAHVRDSAIMDRLDDVCGPENWKNTFGKGPNGGAVCGLSIRVSNEWITKWDTHEILPYTTGATSDNVSKSRGRQVRNVRAMGSGLRRAALQWGIGRYLDRIPKHWMPVAANGRLARRPMLPPDFRMATARDDFESMRLSSGGIGGNNTASTRPVAVAV